MEEDVQEPPAGSQDHHLIHPPPHATSSSRDHSQRAVPPAPGVAAPPPPLTTLHASAHPSFVPLASLAGSRHLPFPLHPIATTAPTSGTHAESSPSAKRGKYGMGSATPVLQPWPPAPSQMNLSAPQQPNINISPANPVFTHSQLALSPSPGPSSASASSFSQSSSPGSVQPRQPLLMIMPTPAGAQLGLLAAAASPSASHSPSHSLIPAASAAGFPAIEPQTQESADAHLPSSTSRKGKFVSPVWKPQEMLALAKAWRLQYSGKSDSTEVGVDPMSMTAHLKAKTRAEKDLEVAEYLRQSGVQRDVKTAATKWDNMLGDFRRVNEWEKGTERDEVGGKSYFRLSSAERKQHRLPASFDEEVYEEMVKYIGHRPRSVGLRSGRGTTASGTISQYGGDVGTDAGLSRGAAVGGSSREVSSSPLKHADLKVDIIGSALVPIGADERKTTSPSVETRGTGGSGGMHRVGRVKMVWEESVHIWGPADSQQGRLKVDNLNFLQADQMVFLDHNISANAIEAFETGPFQGFSTDTFTSGQQLKVFGRRIASHGQLTMPQPIGAVPSVLWDRTSYYLSCLKIAPPMQIPSLADLPRILKEPPPRDLRFPVRTDVFMDLPAGRECFFAPSSEIDCREIMYEVVSPLIRSISTGIGKEFLIGLWDDCINRIVKIFCAEEIELIRSDAGSEEEKANVCGLVRQLCLWRGEERGVSSCAVGDDPAMCLVNKLLWTYGDLPYVLGYHAVGMKVTFCALSRAEPDKLLCTNLITISLSNPAERLSAMTPCWHIAQLLPLLADACARMRNVYSDYSRVQSSSCKVVEVMVSHVRKMYPSRRRWAGVKNVYEVLAEQRIPYAERLVRWDEVRLSLDFKPRGQPIKPASVDALLQALKCVCTALVSLHNISLMHRDLRWENVMKRRDIEEDQWFLIDFEDAAFEEGGGSSSSATSQPPFHYYYPHRLSPSCHAPEMSRGSHGLKVDVWGLGYLIKTSTVPDLPAHLQDLQRRFMDPDPDQRPAIDDCLYLLIQLQSSLSLHYAHTHHHHHH